MNVGSNPAFGQKILYMRKKSVFFYVAIFFEKSLGESAPPSLFEMFSGFGRSFLSV